MNSREELERVHRLQMDQSSIDRRRVTVKRPAETIDRHAARRRPFVGVIVQMPSAVQPIRTCIESEDVADVLVHSIVTQTKPVQVDFVKHGLHRQTKLEMETTQTSEAIRNAISERTKFDSICQCKKDSSVDEA